MTLRSLALCSLVALGGVAHAAPDEAAAAEAEAPNYKAWEAGRWGCLLLGAAAVGIGATSWYMGAAEDDIVADAERTNDGVVISVTQREAKRREDTGNSRRSAGVLTLGIGAALLAAGITLWVLEPERPTTIKEVEKEPEVRPFGYRIGPSVDPGGGMGAEVGLSWSF